MKVEVTHCEITNEMGIAATVELIDENVVQVEIKQPVGWNDWLNISDAVRRAMFLMEVKQP